MLQDKMNKFGKRGKRKSEQKRVPKILMVQAAALFGAQVGSLSTLGLLTIVGLTSIPDAEKRLHWGVLPASAQTATPPKLPDSLPKDSKLTIDGSGSLAAMNEALKEKFSAKYTNTPVTFSRNGSAAGLKALMEDKIDLAAIGRRLTDAEKAQGLVEILIKREKIAMLVSESNPFNGSLTIQQFAKIFRGEIQDWSEVGGAPGPIKLVDQPESSDTRNAFPNYPVFKEKEFKAVASAMTVGDENPESIAAKLGPDGIGYVTADGVKNLKGTRALQMHKTMPEDPLYPFSQPIAYVYKKGKLSPTAKAFLTYVSGEDAKAAIESVSSPGAEIVDTKTAVAGAIAGTAAAGTAAAGTATASTDAASPTTKPVAAVPNAAPATTTTNAIASNPNPTPAVIPPAGGDFPWWLLALLPLGGLLLWGLKGRKGGGASAGQAIPGQTSAPGSIAAASGAAPILADEPPTEIQEPTVPVSEPQPEPHMPFTGAAVPDEALPAAGMAAAAATIGAASFGIATAAAPLMEPNPRGVVVTPVDPWDDESEVEIHEVESHDVDIHGEGTAEVMPRGTEGESGGLAFPIAGAVAAAGVAAAGMAATGMARGDQSPDAEIPELISEPISESIPEPIATVAHEPITQLPPDEYEPLEPDFAINPALSREYNLEEEEDSIEVPVALGITPDALPTPEPNAALGLVGLAAAGAAGVAIAASKFNAGVTDEAPEAPASPAVITPETARLPLDLASVDEGLPELPDGYGESRIILMARDPQWGYTYWDVPDDHRQDLRSQGGQTLALRLYDVTDLDLNTQKPHSLQQYACDEMARDWYLPIPVSDRDYMAEIGYITGAGAWLTLARSNSVRIPPVYPSDWSDDQFVTIDWEEPLESKTFLQLVPPGTVRAEAAMSSQAPVFGMARDAEAMRIAGSFYGSMQPSQTESISSFVFPSGMGMWAAPTTAEEMGIWTLPTPSGMGPTPSGMGMSGISNFSGVGFGASMPPPRSRKFWLVADAELIVYGATEPDAQVTIGGVPIKLEADGTFRFQMSFQDGLLDFPIMAIAKDGEQMRQVRLTFNRSTPLRNTNTKEEAQDEQF